MPQLGADLDADPAHFLFPDAPAEFFPDKRDVLAVRVQSPDGSVEFTVMVVHAKSRYGGRAATDARRVEAARMLVAKIRADFDDVPFVLLGDFNDNPDDQSMNVLETGNPSAAPGPDSAPDSFLLNLTEPLCTAGHVSHGLKGDAIVGDRANPVDPESRNRNNALRGTNANTGDILFDQILIPAWMSDAYVAGSAKVFDFAVAVEGNDATRASDHVPVYAEFVFEAPGDADGGASLRIAALLPNPAGADDRHEQVTLANDSGAAVPLAGWKLVDAQANEYALAGTVAAHGTLTVTLDRSAMLNNTGDTVRLVGPDGVERSSVAYTGAQAASGSVIAFGQ